MMIRRELKAAWRRRGDLVLSLSFFVTLVSISLILWGEEPSLKSGTFFPLFLMMMGFLSLMIKAEGFVEEDYSRGLLDGLLLVPFSPSRIFFAKYVAIVLLWGCPFLAVSSLALLLMGFEETLVLTFLGAQTLAWLPLSALLLASLTLTLGARGGNTLLALLVLPLALPFFILTGSVMDALIHGTSPLSHLYLMAGLGSLLLPLFFFFGTLSLKHAVEHRPCML